MNHTAARIAAAILRPLFVRLEPRSLIAGTAKAVRWSAVPGLLVAATLALLSAVSPRPAPGIAVREALRFTGHREVDLARELLEVLGLEEGRIVLSAPPVAGGAAGTAVMELVGLADRTPPSTTRRLGESPLYVLRGLRDEGGQRQVSLELLTGEPLPPPVLIGGCDSLGGVSAHVTSLVTNAASQNGIELRVSESDVREVPPVTGSFPTRLWELRVQATGRGTAAGLSGLLKTLIDRIPATHVAGLSVTWRGGTIEFHVDLTFLGRFSSSRTGQRLPGRPIEVEGHWP